MVLPILILYMILLTKVVCIYTGSGSDLTNLIIALHTQVLNYHLSRDRYANIFYGILMIHDILLGLFILHTASIL